MARSNFDADEIIRSALGRLEIDLQEGGGGNRNLLTAIEILRNHVPWTRVGDDPGERTDQEQQIITAWNELVNVIVRAHAQPRGLLKSTLLVNVDSSVWLWEILQRHRAAILDCIQQRVGKDVVRKISYHVNDLPSKDILLDFRISESLIKLSATLQPTASGSAPALSAQDLVRTALNSAGAACHIIVSFRPEGSSSASGILKKPPEGPVGDIFAASKSAKLEVFAEDDFTCQRYGRSARDVTLCLGEAIKSGAFNRSFITICIECDHAIRPTGSSIRDALSSDESLRKEQFELMGEFQRLSEHWSALVPTTASAATKSALFATSFHNSNLKRS